MSELFVPMKVIYDHAFDEDYYDMLTKDEAISVFGENAVKMTDIYAVETTSFYPQNNVRYETKVLPDEAHPIIQLDGTIIFGSKKEQVKIYSKELNTKAINKWLQEYDKAYQSVDEDTGVLHARRLIKINAPLIQLNSDTIASLVRIFDNVHFCIARTFSVDKYVFEDGGLPLIAVIREPY